jgi:hypothetical protein
MQPAAATYRQFVTSNPQAKTLSLRYILILSSHQPVKFLCEFLILYLRTTWSSHLITSMFLRALENTSCMVRDSQFTLIILK